MSSLPNLDSHLYVSIRYRELNVEIHGPYNDTWKSVNEVFKKIKLELDTPSTTSIIVAKGKTVQEILINLRNTSFFDTPRSSNQCFEKLKELGKTGLSTTAIKMALKRLVTEGELKRIGATNKYLYLAPYVESTEV